MNGQNHLEHEITERITVITGVGLRKKVTVCHLQLRPYRTLVDYEKSFNNLNINRET